MAEAHEIESEWVPEINRYNAERVSDTMVSQVKNLETGISEHVKTMVEASRENLSGAHVKQLEEVLCKFEDVFAKNEFDLGTFTQIEHSWEKLNQSRNECGAHRLVLLRRKRLTLRRC